MNSYQQQKLAVDITETLKDVTGSVRTNYILRKLQRTEPAINRRQVISCLRGLVIANKVKQLGSSKTFRWQYNRDVEMTFTQAEMQTVLDQMTALKNQMEEIQKESTTGIAEIHLVDTEGKVKRKIKDIFHEKFPRLMQLAQARKNIFLYGPTGSGKSHIAAQLAKCLELPYYFLSCTSGMSEGQLAGRLLPVPQQDTVMETFKKLCKDKIDKQTASILAQAICSGFSYVVGQFVEAFENGGVFLLDEFDAADANVLLLINAALANGVCPVPNRPSNPYAKKHKDFICIGAANTVGNGSDRMYSGRNKLDASTLDRFAIGKVKIDYDKNVERNLCPDADLLSLCHKWRERIQDHRLERAMSTRFLIDAYQMKQEFNWTHDEIADAFFEGWREDEVSKVR